MMERYLKKHLLDDLDLKVILLSGPRQAGKTTLAKALFPDSTEYLNFDSGSDRKILRDEAWRRDVKLVVFDELHKMKNWKRWIKGIYDTQGVRPRLLVTGSARLDVFRKGGDSLAGRHFLFRLHPLSVAEVTQSKVERDPVRVQNRLLALGGFPEPFLSDSEDFALRWRKNHLDRIVREDIIDLENVRQLKSLEILVDLLAERVGSTVSYLSLARDLEVSPKTVKHWVEILERMLVVFVVTPFSKNLARAILKEPKIYFYDTGRVTDQPGARLENLVACALLKRGHFIEDTKGKKFALHYVRDHSGREVDFLTLVDNRLELLIEVKESDGELSRSLEYFTERISPAISIQLVRSLRRETQYGRNGKVRVIASAPWLAQLEA